MGEKEICLLRTFLGKILHSHMLQFGSMRRKVYVHAIKNGRGWGIHDLISFACSSSTFSV
jgi:hypothetical protein